MIRLRVKEVAKSKGFSMGKLQRDADIAYNTVKRIFHNPYYITTTETLDKLAGALGVHPCDLFEYSLDGVEKIEDIADKDEKAEE